MGSSVVAKRKPLRVVRDSVHNLVRFSEGDGHWVKAVIDRPEFQRLRRIRQLGLAFLTYPGAEHSRWAHSFGVCHVARRMLDALLEHHGETGGEAKELAGLRREILAAALLHDVGHGPFSHVFERAIPRVDRPPPRYPKDHEEWSERIIRERFSDELQRHGIDTDVVVGLISKTNRHNLLAKDFISSQLDADRMDYLLRDSRAVGTRYGDFDLEWLLHSIRVGNVKVVGESDPVKRLCFDSGKAIHVVEEYIQAREFMYVQVYIHKTTRAYEAMLKNALGLASAITNGDPQGAPSSCPVALAKVLARQPITVDEYLSLDDFRLWCTLLDWARLDDKGDARVRMLASLCERIVHRGRPYRRVEMDRQYDDDDRRYDRAIELQSEWRGTPSQYALCLDSFKDLAYRSIFYRKSKETEDQEDRAIQLLAPSGFTEPVEQASPLIRAISDLKIQIHRLYYDENDPELAERLQKDGWIE
jgi:HD superfamily phosphohydrolase